MAGGELAGQTLIDLVQLRVVVADQRGRHQHLQRSGGRQLRLAIGDQHQ